MIKIAVYGKGGIGKSTTVSNVAAALAEKGLTVMQIGCDPKADSTIQLRHGKEMRTVLDLYNEKKQNLKLKDMTMVGYQGVICVEAGGPTPGLGCAGRGIITALEKLKDNIRFIGLVSACFFQFFESCDDTSSCTAKSRCRAACFHADHSLIPGCGHVF